MPFGRLARRLALAFGIVLGLVLLAGLGAAAFLRSAAGDAWVAARIEAAARTDDQRLALFGLSGALPTEWRLRRAELADRQGVWLRLDDVSIHIDARALLRRTIRIDRLAIGSIAILRTPDTGSSASSGGLALPVSIELGSLAIDRLTVAIAGSPTTLAVAGHAGLHPDRGDAALSIRRAEGGGLTLDLAYGPGSDQVDRLDLALHAADESGTALAGLDGGTALPLRLDLTGGGPLAGWSGRLSTAVGTADRIDADLTLAVARDTVATVTGKAQLHALLPDALRPVLGDGVKFDLAGRRAPDGALVLDHLGLALAAGTVEARGHVESESGQLQGTIDAKLDLTALGADAGRAVLTATLGGSTVAPSVQAKLAGTEIAIGDYRASTASAALELGTRPDGRYHLSGTGRLDGTALPRALPAGTIDKAIDWTLDGSVDPGLHLAILDKATASSRWLTLDAAGRVENGAASGHLALETADLSVFGLLVGARIAGSGKLEAELTSPDGAGASASISGRVREFRSFIPVADALLGRDMVLAGHGERDATGTITVDRFRVAGTHAELAATARFQPGAAWPSGTATLTLGDLRPLGPALGLAVSGRAGLTAEIDGERARARLTAAGAIGSATIDRAEASLDLDDVAHPVAGLEATVKAGTTEARLEARVLRPDEHRLNLDRITLAGPQTEAHGKAVVDLSTGLVAGTLNLRAADLSAWSALAGTGLRGRLGLDLALGTRSGQSVDASVDGAGLGGGGVTAGTIRAALHLEDLRRAPHGTATLRAATVQAGAGVIDHLALDGRIAGLGSIGLTATGAGSVAGHPVDAAAEATLGLGQDTQSLELDHARLAIGGLAARLERPVQLTRRGDAVAISGLEATVNRGHLAGSGRFDGHTVEVTLSAADLPVGAAAALIGRPNVDGSLGLDLALTGPLAAPRGEARLALDHLRITSAGVRPPALALVASAALSPGRLDFKGRLDGAGETAALGFAGTVPLTSGSAWPVLDRGGRLSGQLEGAGSLAALQELAPIGEDRLDGRYAIDLTVGGTPAAPEAGGTLRISDAGYDNQLSGLTLRGLQMVLTGRNQAYELTRFEATDGAAGRLTASGRLELGAEGGPRFDLAAVLRNFTAARTDALGGSVSGSARIDGTLTNPRVSGELTIDQATVSLPERLPPDIVVLDVIRIDSRHPGAKPVRPPPPAPPIVAQLEVSVHDPGPSFVRGRGLDSEWKGDLAIRGTSAAPLVTGQLSAINGTYALLGTDFSISRGLVYFTGSLEPSFDIEAQAAATDITAVVDLRGTPTKPGLTLSSTPVLPQDEILSRLLFGSGTSQLNPAQGLELAQAAASLAGGGGPGVIDRLRNFTGLDRLSLGSAAPDPGRSPPPGGSGTGSGTTLSGGNYVAPGVFVGAAQGLGGATRAKVAITISPHVTVNAATGTGGPEGSTVGVQYQRDY